MSAASDQHLVAHIRRFSSDGARLHVRIDPADIARLGLSHGQLVELNVGGRVCVRGIVKTSGGTPWLAPGKTDSNAGITEALRAAGFEHADDASAAVRLLRSSPPLVAVARPDVRPGGSLPRTLGIRHLSGCPRFDPEATIGAVRAYNAGQYRGRANLDVDRIAYERFRAGLPDDVPTLVEMVRFVGEDYGGAQRRFLPHGYRDEAALIVANLRPVLDQWRAAVASARPLAESVAEEATLASLLAPFVGTKRWPVWASKTLHFLRPDAFPILDSRAKKALGLATLGSSPRNYHRFFSALHDALFANHEHCILTGEIVERQKDRRTGEWKYLVEGKTLSGQRGVVVSKVGPTGKLVFITVYLLRK